MADTITSTSVNLFRQGIGHMESDKLQEALLCFEQVYKTEGHIPNLHYACAVAFMKLGKKEDAVLACQSEIAINPDHCDAITLLNKLIYHDNLSWPENRYLVNHEHRFIYCPISRSMSTNMRKAMLKIAGLHEKHGHTEGIYNCKVHGDIHACSRKEFLFKTNVGQTLKILNDDRYFKFTVVRNPWSRLVSSYLSKLINGKNYWGKSYEKVVRQIRAENDLSPDMGSSVTFRQFAEHETRKGDMQMDLHWRPHVCFIGGHKFDFIAKFENIQNDLNYINNKLDLNFDINFRKNTAGYMKNATHQDKYFCDCYADELRMVKKYSGGFPGYKQFYPPELKELVGRRYACDIETFGYEF